MKGSVVSLFLFAHLKFGRHVPHIRLYDRTVEMLDQKHRIKTVEAMEFIREVSAKCWQICPKFAPVPGDDVAGEIIEHRRQVEPPRR